MLIAGLQKMSLVDFPGKVACTVFTGGCNLHCPFCHNSELLASPPTAMSGDELFAFLEKRTGLLDGVCVTGGEPCLQKDLPDFLRRLRQLPFAVKLDTNGLFPDVLGTVLSEGLADYVAMDVKNSPERFTETAGLSGCASGPMERFRESLSLLFSSSVPFELRTTVVKQFHDRAAFEGIRSLLLPYIGRYGRKAPAYYLQPFRDRETVPYAGLTAPSESELRAYAEILAPAADHVTIRGI